MIDIDNLISSSTFCYIDNEAFGYDYGIALINKNGNVVYSVADYSIDMPYNTILQDTLDYISDVLQTNINDFIGIYYFADYEGYFIPFYGRADYYIFSNAYPTDSVNIYLQYVEEVDEELYNAQPREVYYNKYFEADYFALNLGTNRPYGYSVVTNYFNNVFDETFYNNFDRNIYDIGWSTGNNIRIGWYTEDNTAYDNGYYQGYGEGYNNGREAGYQEGYRVGSLSDEQANAFTYIGNAVGAVGHILEIEILPHISLGLVASIPIVFGILMSFIRLVKK